MTAGQGLTLAGEGIARGAEKRKKLKQLRAEKLGFITGALPFLQDAGLVNQDFDSDSLEGLSNDALGNMERQIHGAIAGNRFQQSRATMVSAEKKRREQEEWINLWHTHWEDKFTNDELENVLGVPLGSGRVPDKELVHSLIKSKHAKTTTGRQGYVNEVGKYYHGNETKIGIKELAFKWDELSKLGQNEQSDQVKRDYDRLLGDFMLFMNRDREVGSEDPGLEIVSSLYPSSTSKIIFEDRQQVIEYLNNIYGEKLPEYQETYVTPETPPPPETPETPEPPKTTETTTTTEPTLPPGFDARPSGRYNTRGQRLGGGSNKDKKQKIKEKIYMF